MSSYNLEIERIIRKIKEKKAKYVLLQLPDGLKPEAEKIVQEIQKNTNAISFIWLGDCFGACDIPLGLQQFQIDLIVQFGHNTFIKEFGW